jgi:hypothetical protein
VSVGARKNPLSWGDSLVCRICGWDHSKHVGWECTQLKCDGCGHSLITFKVTVTRLTDNSVVSEEHLCYSCYQKENS